MHTIHDRIPETAASINRARLDVEDPSGEVITLICRFLWRNRSRFQRGHLDFDHPSPPFSRLFLILKGGAEVEAAGRHYRLEPGPFHLLPSGLAFRVHYRDGTEMHGFHLHLFDRTGRSVFSGMNRIMSESLPDVTEMIMRGFAKADLAREFSLIMLLLREAVRPQWTELIDRARRASHFPQLFRFLAENPIAAVRIEDLAALQGVTANALSKRFHRVMGVTLKEFLLTEQMRRAQELLARTDLTVEQLAHRLGHENASYFHRLFRRRCEISPGEYRRKVRARFEVDAGRLRD